MPPRSLLRGFLALWIVTGVVLLVASVETARDAWIGSSHANPHLVWLASFEAVAAVLFLLPRVMRIGAVGLLTAIAIALIVHVAMGQFRGDLLIYGAGVLFVAIHGPLTQKQWEAAVSRAA